MKPFLLLLLPMFCAGAALADGGFSSSLSHSHSRGQFGGSGEVTQDKTTLGLAWGSADYGLDLALPWLRQSNSYPVTSTQRRPMFNARGQVVGSRMVSRSSSAAETISGLGDASLGASRYVVLGDDDELLLELRAAVKLANGDADRGLGTGKTDYTLQGGLTRYWDWGYASASGGYTLIGKTDPDMQRNSAFASLGVYWQPTRALTLGLSGNYDQAVSRDKVDPASAGASVSYRFSRDWSASGYLRRGLSDGAADRDFGATLNVNW